MKPVLRHKDEFKKLLHDYKISSEGIASVQDLELVLLVGPTASGRNTIIERLVQQDAYRQIVSDTTRPPRKNNGILERNGVEYWFRTEEQMLEDILSGKMLEAALIHDQQVSGTSLRVLKDIAEHNQIAINEVEHVGAHNIFSVKPNTHIFFVIPPSFDEWMSRLLGRGSISTAELRGRLQTALVELQAAREHEYYTVLVNDNIDDSVKELSRSVDRHTKNANRDLGLKLVGQLEDSLRLHLQKL